MAQRTLGLDVGARSVKAVVVEAAYRGYTVLATARADVEPAAGPDAPALRDRQADALKRLLAEAHLVFDNAVVALPGAPASHVITLPFVDPRRIDQTVGFEVESQIPFDLTEVVWDWQPLGTRDGKTELLVSVVRKEEMASLLAALAGAGVDPRVAAPPAPSYAPLFAAGAVAAAPVRAPMEGEPSPAGDAPAAEAVAESTGAEALLDVGAARTSLCVMAGGACEAARTLPLGSRDVVQRMASLLGTTEDAVWALLGAVARGEAPPEAAAGLADGRAAAARAALAQAAAPLARELRATLRAWRARRGPGAPPLRRLVLAGDLARVPWLADALAAEVDGTVEPLALAGPAAEKIGADEAPGLALALALALRQQAHNPPRINLRRGEFAYTRDFQHVRGKVMRLAAWASLVVLLAIVSSAVKVFALSRQEGLIDKAFCDATQKLVGKCYDDSALAIAVLKGRGTPAAAIPKNSAVDVFAELATRTPHDFALKFDRMEITRDKLHLQGTTDAAENVDKVVTALRGSRCFGDARSGGARKRSGDGKFEFTIDSDLTCDTGEKPAPRT
jgi:general secretion pathway protein L